MVGKRLQQAREVAGLTQTTLAAEIGVTQSQISAAEAERSRLSEEALSRVAEVTGFPLGFFGRPVCSDVHETAALRSKARLPAWRKKQVLRFGEIVLDQMLAMRQRVNALELQVSALPSEDIGVAAARTRQAIGLTADEAALGLPLLLEHAGVLVLGLPLEGGTVDAFSDWVGQDAVIWLLDTPAGDRQNWSLGHELGHLVMKSRDCGVADEFARRFLVPASAMRVVSERTTLQEYSMLKRSRHISIQALVRSAHAYGLISKDRYQSLFRQISARGERLRERLTVPPMKPRGFRKVAEELWGPTPTEALAEDASWTEIRAGEVLERHASAGELAPRRVPPGRSRANVVPIRPV